MGLITICLLAGGVVWKIRQPAYPDNCTEYKRPNSSDIALLCQEASLNDTYIRFSVRVGQAANAPMIDLGAVCSSYFSSYPAGNFWSKDGSLFIVTIADVKPNAPFESRVFEAGYDFLKHQRVQSSQFKTLLHERGGPGPILN